MGLDWIFLRLSGSRKCSNLCGHKLLSIIVRFAPILQSTCDPGSWLRVVALRATSLRPAHEYACKAVCLLTQKTSPIYGRYFLCYSCAPGKNRSRVTKDFIREYTLKSKVLSTPPHCRKATCSGFRFLTQCAQAHRSVCTCPNKNHSEMSGFCLGVPPVRIEPLGNPRFSNARSQTPSLPSSTGNRQVSRPLPCSILTKSMYKKPHKK